MITLLYEM